jgi:cation diffusion facilitator family transporter
MVGVMSPVRRTALISVLAAAVLIGLKLVVGLLTHSLGLLSEAAHSGTDLVAALLTFFALGVSGRPADATHAWGHGKAEHLAALAESITLAGVSAFIGWHAVQRLTGDAVTTVDAAWYAFAVIGLVIVIDLTRALVSLRSARRYSSPALLSNAIHFASDLAGTLAVLVGLLFVHAGYVKADAVAALFVALLVMVAAGKLAATNVDVLMDRTPTDAEDLARRAIEALAPAITLDRLRMRTAAGRHFADVVISMSPSAALAEGHAAADAVEAAVLDALPGSDVVVHVEPAQADSVTEGALAAALTVAGVREIHNVRVLRAGGRIEVSLHLKFPGDASLDQAHALASDVEDAIERALPSVTAVTTHLEPLAAPIAADDPAAAEVAATDREVRRIVTELTGNGPRELRFVGTDGGLVAFLTLSLNGDPSLAAAHEMGGTVRSRLRRERPELADVVVHTEPSAA